MSSTHPRTTPPCASKWASRGRWRRVGTSADNALAEWFNATLKRETLQGAARWATAADARHAVFKWIINYNARRWHSACGYLSPTNYENTYQTATHPLAA